MFIAPVLSESLRIFIFVFIYKDETPMYLLLTGKEKEAEN